MTNITTKPDVFILGRDGGLSFRRLVRSDRSWPARSGSRIHRGDDPGRARRGSVRPRYARAKRPAKRRSRCGVAGHRHGSGRAR